MSTEKIHINTRFLTQNVTGVQRFSFEIYKQLVKIRTDVVGIMPNQDIVEDYYLDECDRILKIGDTNGHRWEQFTLPSYLKKKKNPLLLGLGNLGPIRYENQIVTIHDLSFLNGNWHSFAFRNAYKLVLPLLAKKSKHIFTVSEFSKNEIIKFWGTPEDKITVVYNAPFSVDEKLIMDHQVMEGKKRYLLSVGSIDPRKNLKRLVKAFLDIDDKDIKLFLIGKTNKNFAKDPELSSLIKDNERRIVFLGYVSDTELKEYYRNATAFVYPSLYEGFGLPPVEAMSLGCPVITSDCCSLPEVCGDAAVYCNPEIEGDICEKINYVLKNGSLRNEMKDKGLVQAKKFNWYSSGLVASEVIDKIY